MINAPQLIGSCGAVCAEIMAGKAGLSCRDGDGASLETVGRYGQREVGGCAAALYEHLGQAVEGRYLECAAVDILRVVCSEIGGVAVAGSDDAGITVETEGERRAGIGHDTPLGILHLDGDNGNVAPVVGGMAECELPAFVEADDLPDALCLRCNYSHAGEHC